MTSKTRVVALLCMLAAWQACNLVQMAEAGQVVYPLFKQCDPRWGGDEMGVNGPGERATICKEGCAMSSLSMALAGLGVSVDGDVTNPGTVNQWLEGNNGYTCADGDCNNLVLTAPTRLTPMLKLVGEIEKPSVGEIRANLTAQTQVFIAHVHDRTHFVLLTGWDDLNQEFTVNDPYYNTTTYAWSSIADIIIYQITGAASGIDEGVTPPLPPTAVVPYPYPLYKQCNKSWGNDMIETTTVCAVGCLMSSTSMAIGGKNILIDVNNTRMMVSTPGSLNVWLRGNNGYTMGNDLKESVVPGVNPSHISWPADGMHTTNDIPMSGIRAMLKEGRPVIANVMHGHHFVLVIGWDTKDDDTLYINDPGFSKTTYSYSQDVVGWRLFDMLFNN